MRILVTGGAGFIGKQLVQQLVKSGQEVTVLDNLLPQVHGDNAKFPEFYGEVVTIHGDIRDAELIKNIVTKGFDVVYHLAAMTGVGQSMYQIENYVDINSRGTSILLEALVSSKKIPRKIILASSRAVYGEGHLKCNNCGLDFYPELRSNENLTKHLWEHLCPNCRHESVPLETNETSPLHPTSIYAITKLEQENLFRTISSAYGIPAVILRYFNVYGPGQAPNNPYTGVLSIFSRRLINKQGIEIYENGSMMRDFIYIQDIVQANILALDEKVTGTFNICSGEAVSIYQVAKILCDILKCSSSSLSVTGNYRVGDIRHCFALPNLARQHLNFKPKVLLRDGLDRLVSWMSSQKLNSSAIDTDKIAKAELLSRGLLGS